MTEPKRNKRVKPDPELLNLKKAVKLPDCVELSDQLARGISVREHEFGKCARKDCA